MTNDSLLLLAEPGSTSINLSKATRLKVLAFRPTSENVEWVTAALRTVALGHRDLRQVSIYVRFDPNLTNIGVNVGQAIGEEIFRQCLDLDRLLAQLWESHSILPEIMSPDKTRDMVDRIGCLFPEIRKKRMLG